VSLGHPELKVSSMTGDGLGNVHALWRATVQGGQTYYHSLRAPNGTWTALTAIDGGQHAYAPLMAADATGGLHVLWKRDTGGDTRFHYAYRSPGGVWQTPIGLAGSANLDKPLWLDVDSRGNVYALSEESRSSRFLFKPAGAGWAPIEDMDARFRSWVQAKALAVGPDDRVYVVGSIRPGNWDTESEPAVLARTAEGQWSIEYGAPLVDNVTAFDIGLDGSLYVVIGNPYESTTTLFWRDPSGAWRQTTPPLAGHGMVGAVDSLGRLHALSRDGAYTIWTPNKGWLTPTPLDVAWGSLAVDAYDLPHVIGPAADPDVQQQFYFGPAGATAASSSTLWQQVAIPANMPSPTLAFMQRLHGRLPGGQTALRAFVDDGGVITPLPVAAGGRAWSLAWADLTPWQGKTVKVGVTLEQAAGEPQAQAWIDDITLTPGYADVDVQAQGPRAVSPGEAADLRIEVRNQGGVDTEWVELHAQLDDDLTFVSASPPPTTTEGQLLRWSLGSLPAFSDVQVIILKVRGEANHPYLNMPRYIPIGAGTTTPERHYENNERVLELIVAEESFLPLVR
jgi:hypothetical protein